MPYYFICQVLSTITDNLTGFDIFKVYIPWYNICNRGNIITRVRFMEKILKYLEQLDLSEIEAKLYLRLLETGPVSVRDIANLVNIKRTTTYLYIEQLLQKGLITKVTVGAKTQIAAVQPEAGLEHLVSDKVTKAKTIEQKFPEVLQNIDSVFPEMKGSSESEIKYYKGRLGAKKIYEEALKAEEIRSYVNLTILADKFPENTELFAEAFKQNKDLKIIEIFEDSDLAKEQAHAFKSLILDPDRYLYKFLPKGVLLSAADTLIYDGKVGIINVRNQITGVLIRDGDYYNNSKEIFDLLWKVLPEVK